MLPAGYLDFDPDQYTALPVEIQREVYRAMRAIVRYTVGRAEVNAHMMVIPPETPVEWIMSIKRLTCMCERCRGTGEYAWGACVNGKMTNTGPCFRCNGKGIMNFDDMRRCKAYDNYAIARACR